MSYYDEELINEIMDNEERALQDYYEEMAGEALEMDLAEELEKLSIYEDVYEPDDGEYNDGDYCEFIDDY